jgi:hypothetical protein
VYKFERMGDIFLYIDIDKECHPLAWADIEQSHQAEALANLYMQTKHFFV